MFQRKIIQKKCNIYIVQSFEIAIVEKNQESYMMILKVTIMIAIRLRFIQAVMHHIGVASGRNSTKFLRGSMDWFLVVA